ncbi:hypothetical protein RJ639_029367 [Escallonia herrerae]|uniref:FCP1 homology domain-containing protein n=1 Tax=Escallonia herrerae TaxID=1293975 RepID=A0AA88XBE6_9ASTE|nr:hypothetical protein RJ639_029367 [Escallonia herrerae]
MLFLLKKLILVLDFELYIFTKACRPHALEMENLLDPEGVYFDPTRVFSREHCDQEALKHLDWVGVVSRDRRNKRKSHRGSHDCREEGMTRDLQSYGQTKSSDGRSIRVVLLSAGPFINKNDFDM